MKLSEKNWQMILAAVCLVYILFRFLYLTDSCLWFDEIFGIHAAEHDWQSLLGFVAKDLIHPPLFYILLKTWISAGGAESLFWLRFFPVFFSAAALVPFYFLCRQLKLNYPTIALALIFFAANGALVKYAQEVRMYALLLCLSLFSLWLFARFFSLGKSYVALTIVNILLVYSHYFGWLVVLSEIAAILILQRIKIRQVLIMLGICLLSFTPWIFAVWRAAHANTGFAQNIGWIGKPNLSTLSQFVIDLIEPFYYQASSIDATSRFYISIPLWLIFITTIIFYFSGWKGKDETEKTRFYLLGIFILTPMLSAFALSWLLPYSVWGTRHLIIVFAPAAILLSSFLNEIKNKPLKISLISLIFLIIAIAFALQIKTEQTKYIWCGWENLAENLKTNEPQKIYVFEDLIAYHFWFALRGEEGSRVQIIKVKDIEGIAEDKAYFLPRGFDSVQTTDESGITGERFWIAFQAVDFRESEPPLRNLIVKGYKIGEPKVFQAQGVKAFLVSVEK